MPNYEEEMFEVSVGINSMVYLIEDTLLRILMQNTMGWPGIRSEGSTIMNLW